MTYDKRVCIIGAGCSGFTPARRLQDEGISFDCFEISDDIGGNWYYKSPNGKSACYQSLHDTSKWRLAFEDYPVPENCPISRATRSCGSTSATMWIISASGSTWNTAVTHAARQPVLPTGWLAISTDQAFLAA